MKGVIYEKRIELPEENNRSSQCVNLRLTEELNGYLLVIVPLDYRTNNEIHGTKKTVLGWWDLGSPYRELAIETAVAEALKIAQGEVEE